MSRLMIVSTFFARHSARYRLAAILLMSISGIARATTLTWDPNLSSGANPGGSGTWDLSTTANWANAGVDQQWTDTTGADSANFTLPTSGAVSLVNNLAANNLTFSHS